MKKNLGMALVEILIGSAIISAGILAVSSVFSTYVQYAFANQQNVSASYVLEEGLEVVTFFRDKGWENISKLSTTTTYYLFWDNDNWATTTTPQYIDDIFLRKINVEDIKRGAEDEISTSGTYDPNTKKITATVEYWQGHGTTTRSISTYITNLYQ
jgi:type II secretory pathway pseudopilin PulG